MKRRKNNRKNIRIKRGIYILPSIFTSLSLFCGFYSITASINDSFMHASWAIGLAAAFDAIDGKRKGFAMFVGGKEGEDTRLGEKIADFLSEEEALQLTEECMRILKERNVNAATIVDEVGLERFKEMLVLSSE